MFLKTKDDPSNAPDKYVVRVKSYEGDYIFYKNYKDIATIFNCSTSQVKSFIQDRRTISFDEWFKFRLKGK